MTASDRDIRALPYVWVSSRGGWDSVNIQDPISMHRVSYTEQQKMMHLCGPGVSAHQPTTLLCGLVPRVSRRQKT